jgi:endonuclease/exonuclease/phosphatase family metal-dependent hydrolase
MKILTYNIRVQVPRDKNEKSWFNRKSLVAKVINDNQADIVSVQEVGNWYQKWSLQALLKGYKYHGRGRGAIINPGSEEVGIFWKDSKFKLLDKGHFFLSETPNERTIGWDAMYIKPLAWVKLEDKDTCKKFYVLSTHFDHVGKIARQESAKLIVNFINTLDCPSLVMGDLNTSIEQNEGVIEFLSSNLTDAVNSPEVIKLMGTYNGYLLNNSGIEKRIDYIYTKGIDLIKYETIDILYNGVFPSDHFPVALDFNIK